MGSDQSNPVLSYIAVYLRERESDLVSRLENIRATIPLLAGITDRTMRYQVDLISLWAEAGEKPVSVTRKGSLRSAMRRAVKQFKQVNRRTDVQAKWKVYALIGERDNPFLIPVPQTFWADIERELSAS